MIPPLLLLLLLVLLLPATDGSERAALFHCAIYVVISFVCVCNVTCRGSLWYGNLSACLWLTLINYIGMYIRDRAIDVSARYGLALKIT